MRILIAIPHFFGGTSRGNHGSLSGRAGVRRHALEACIRVLHYTFGKPQAMLDGRERRAIPANTEGSHSLDIVVCTTGDRHLLESLDLPDGLFRHHPTTAEPMMLGFECHAVLRDRIDDYDYFGFLEDDLIVADPTYFAKLTWFTGWAGDDCVLQPNRYELSLASPFRKLYIDGPLPKDWSAAYQDVDDRPALTAQVMGYPLHFRRPHNPHAGCFFLSAQQMGHWVRQRWFLDGDIRFVSPLESAATIGIMRTFRVYKPAIDNAAFLEIQHADNRYQVTARDGGMVVQRHPA